MAFDDELFGLDYLGRRQPIGQQRSAVPPEESGGGAPGPLAGGQPAAVPGTPGGPTGQPGSTAGANPGARLSGPSALNLALLSGLSGLKALSFARALIGSGSEATGAGTAGAGVGFTTSGEAVIGGGGLAEAPALATGFELLGQAAPYWAALTAAVDLLGEGKPPFYDVLNAIFGFDQPSRAWRTYPSRLAETSQLEDATSADLARTLATAQGPDEIRQAIAQWEQTIGERIKGFGQGAGEFEIPGLPSATGGRHERQAVDFTPVTLGLQALVEAALRGEPVNDRIAAFLAAPQGYFDQQRAYQEQARVGAEQLSQFQSLNTGSA